jgi:hypothetical protein
MKLLSFLVLFLLTSAYSEGQFLESSFSISGNSNLVVGHGKTDLEGNTIVLGTFEGEVDLDPGEGELIFTGETGRKYAFVLKLSPIGELIWLRKFVSDYSNTNNNSLSLSSIAIDSENNLLMTGTSNLLVAFENNTEWLNETNGIFLIKLSSTGDLIWSTELLYSAMNVQITSTNDILVGGNINSSYTHCYLTKVSGTGEIQWTKHFESSNFIGFNTTGNIMAIGSQNNVCIVGSYEDTFDADPGLGVYLMTSTGLKDNFIIMLNNEGDFLWAKSFGNAESDWVMNVVLDNNDNLYFCGFFAGTIDMDPGEGEYFADGGIYAGYLNKLDYQGNFIWSVNSIGISYNRLDIGANNELYTQGSWSSQGDLDPDSSIVVIGSIGLPYGDFFATYDSLGHYHNSIYTSKTISAYNVTDVDHVNLFCNLNGQWGYQDSVVVLSNSGEVWQFNVTDVATDYLLRVSLCANLGCMDETAINFDPLAECAGPCIYDLTGDFNFDGLVDILDLNILLSTYGCVEYCPELDMDGNGVVGVSDLLLWIAQFG